MVELAEKKVISTHSLNGIHYWKKGASFVFSTEELMRRNIRVNNEFYISMTYNILIEHGQQIQIYPIEQHMHHAVGVPEDFLHYESYVHKKITSFGETQHPSPS